MVISTCDELKKVLSQRKAMVFGAGYVARRFYKALKENNLSRMISCYVTTNGQGETVDGLEVRAIDDIDVSLKPLICIAVHEALLNGVIDELEGKGFADYVWITPFLLELLLGAPIVRNKKVLLKDIWMQNRDGLAIAARCLAIDQYFGKNDCGYAIYKKTLSLFGNEETSKIRLSKFIKLIENWETNGYDDSRVSSLMENGVIVDGMHRISLALYCGLESVCCDIYPIRPYSEVNPGNSNPQLSRIDSLGFSDYEISALLEMNQRISKKY